MSALALLTPLLAVFAAIAGAVAALVHHHGHRPRHRLRHAYLCPFRLADVVAWLVRHRRGRRPRNPLFRFDALLALASGRKRR